MKRPRDRSPQNAPQTYERKRSVTITFPDSPFFGQEGRLLNVTLGKHCELYLELPNGKRIRIDASWTNYADATKETCSKRTTHRIDLMQIQPLVRLIEYLDDKLRQHIEGHSSIQTE